MTSVTPTGYIAIRAAVRELLHHRYGSVWGKREISLETEEIEMAGQFELADGSPLKGQPYDRKAVAEAGKQELEARTHLIDALKSGELTAELEPGTSLGPSYWKRDVAATTMTTGALEIGNDTDPEILRWRHRSVFIEKKMLINWLKGETGIKSETRGRHRDPEKDAVTKAKIETVLAVARRRWPDMKNYPGRNQAARLLIEERPVRETGYAEGTIRKILNGTYSASKTFGIPGIADIDPR